MELISRLIIGKKSKNPEKRDIIWNMAGSFLYAFASMVLSIAVVQIAGRDAGGIFTFAFTTFGQHMVHDGVFRDPPVPDHRHGRKILLRGLPGTAASDLRGGCPPRAWDTYS